MNEQDKLLQRLFTSGTQPKFGRGDFALQVIEAMKRHGAHLDVGVGPCGVFSVSFWSRSVYDRTPAQSDDFVSAVAIAAGRYLDAEARYLERAALQPCNIG